MNVWSINFDRDAKNIQWGKNGVRKTVNGVRKTGQSRAKEWNWTTILHHTQKSTQNELRTWIKLLEEIIGLSNDFLDLTPKAKATKAKINK